MNLNKNKENEMNFAIVNEPLLRGSAIMIAITDINVVLTGTVNQFRKKHIAEKLVAMIATPKIIIQKIEVVPARHFPDIEILEEISGRLRINLGLSSEKITTSANNGRVRMEGQIAWNYQKELAFQSISDIEGIRDIENCITVSPLSNELLLKKQIQKVLPLVTQHKIHISITGNNVFLKGWISSLQEKQAINDIIGKIGGVGEIRNELQIYPG